MKSTSQLKKDMISACRILSHEKLVEGFGHVSARIPNSDLFLMTPRIGLALVTENDLLTVNFNGEVIEGKHPAPSETWLHTAIMKAKPGVNAITRIHARVANMFSVTDRKLEPVHNHGSFFAGGVPVFHKPDLITTQKLGQEVVASSQRRTRSVAQGKWSGDRRTNHSRGGHDGNISRGSRRDSSRRALQIGAPIPLTSAESAKRQVEALPPVDMERAWNFFKRRAKSG